MDIVVRKNGSPTIKVNVHDRRFRPGIAVPLFIFVPRLISLTNKSLAQQDVESLGHRIDGERAVLVIRMSEAVITRVDATGLL